MAEKEYIERETALNLIDRYWQQAYNAHFLDAAVRLGSVYREMEDIPAADVRPVVRGRWIYEPGHIPRCSVCGRYSDDADTGEAICCPFCGAKMEEET